MSSSRVATDVRAVQMRVTYFMQGAEVDASDSPEAEARIGPEDVRRAFRQIELLIEYARDMSAGPNDGPEGSTADPEVQAALADLAASQLAAELAQSELLAAHTAESLRAARRNLGAARATLEGKRRSTVESDVVRDAPTEESRVTRAADELNAAHEAAQIAWRRAEEIARGGGRARTDPGSGVAIRSIEMGSPMRAVVEIPPALWPVIGSGILLLIERIATAPVRIARKRKEELLKSVVLDVQTDLVKRGQAEVLAGLLRKEGPIRLPGPDEVVFIDPDDPDDELDDH